MRNLRVMLLLGMVLLLVAGTASAVNVTFRVNMNVQTQLGNFDASVDSVGVNGTINNWGNPATRMFDEDEDGIYEATMDLTAGNEEFFKFVIAFDGDFGNLDWEGVDDRPLTVPDEDTVLDVIWYNDQEEAGETAPYEVLFLVNMELAVANGTFDPEADGLIIRGNTAPLAWSEYDNELIPIGATDTYAIEIQFESLEINGAALEFKYVIDPNGDNDPNAAVWEGIDNRTFVPDGTEEDTDDDGYFNVILDEVYWSNQEAGLTVPVDVTFVIDGGPALRRTDAEGSDWLPGDDVEYILIAGSFNSWANNWTGVEPAAMDDGEDPDETAGDSTFTEMIAFSEGSPLEHEYKYGANGADNEAGFAVNRDLVLSDDDQNMFVYDQFGENDPDNFGEYLIVHELRSSVIPTEFTLDQNYPNPFNPSTTIAFTLPSPGDVMFRVFNVTGQEVMAQHMNGMNAGRFQIDLDASRFSSGVYFYRVEANGMSLTKKMVLTK
jgi:Secretion system C-terminal sorting domain